MAENLKPHWMKAARESDCSKCGQQIAVGDDFFFAARRLYICKACMKRGESADSGKMPVPGHSGRALADAPTLTLRSIHNLITAVQYSIVALFPEEDEHNPLIKPLSQLQLDLRRRERT